MINKFTILRMSDAKTGITHPRKARNTQFVKDPDNEDNHPIEAISLAVVADLFESRRFFKRHFT